MELLDELSPHSLEEREKLTVGQMMKYVTHLLLNDSASLYVYSSHHLTSFMMINAYFLTTVSSNTVFFLLYKEKSTVVTDGYLLLHQCGHENMSQHNYV